MIYLEAKSLYMSYALKLLGEEYERITSKFDLEDWRTVRDEDYWESDKIKDPVQRLNYKMSRIRHYDKYGTTLKNK
jgi:hypothetical protein